MKKPIIIILLLFLAASCHDPTGPKDKPNPKMVPDHTPYIAGLIEASPDTTFHYPEVVVGYFTDPQIGYYTNYQNSHAKGLLVNKQLRPQQHYKNLYSITLTRQLAATSVIFGLSWQPESHAVVTVRGPLGRPQEKQVKFTSEGRGVYGDEHNGLPLVASGRYELQVNLPDGRAYVSRTYIPDSVSISMKSSFSMPILYRLYKNGDAREEYPSGYRYLYTPPQNGYLTVLQHNSNRDRQLDLLKPNEQFLYANYGNYLRQGSYYINFTSDQSPDTLLLPWQQNLNKTRDKVWSSQHWWLRYSFFSKGISKMFTPPFVYVTTTLKYSHFDAAPADSALANDTHYLHNVSTIRKANPKGKALPHKASDAIGFFGGEYSRYLQTTVYANRQFDLDSLLKATGYE